MLIPGRWQPDHRRAGPDCGRGEPHPCGPPEEAQAAGAVQDRARPVLHRQLHDRRHRRQQQQRHVLRRVAEHVPHAKGAGAAAAPPSPRARQGPRDSRDGPARKRARGAHGLGPWRRRCPVSARSAWLQECCCGSCTPPCGVCVPARRTCASCSWTAPCWTRQTPPAVTRSCG